MAPYSSPPAKLQAPWLRVESALMGTARGVRQAFDKRFGEEGLNLSHAMMIAFLADFGPHSQTQIAERLRLGKAATGACVDQLETRGLVTRNPDPDDRRVWLVSCTDDGMAMTVKIAEIDAVLQAELRLGLSKADRHQLAALLNKIQSNLEPILNEPIEYKTESNRRNQ